MSSDPSRSPRPTRVAIVDDSVVVRGLLSRWIEAEPGFAIGGTAPNGRAGLDLVRREKPDIVLLDLDMPELDGIAALPLYLQADPRLSVVVISTLTQRNAEISLRCLRLGAVDYLPKPVGSRDLTLSGEFRRELIAKLVGLAGRPRGVGLASPSPAAALPAGDPSLGSLGRSVRAILIGASTGGPRAVVDVMRALGPAARDRPILIVQHMPPIFTRVFARQVETEVGIPTREAVDGERVEPGRAYLAPGGRHLGLSGRDGDIHVRIDDGPALHHCRPALDILFRDAAELYRGAALAIVLTGMGSDGLEGARALAGAGATILAQDEKTSVVWGMPGAVVRAGLVRAVLPLDRIGHAVEAALARGDRPDRGAGHA